MSGMLAVSKPPTIITDGLRKSHASVTGKNVCQDANQPKTRSERSTAGTRPNEVGDAAGLVPVAQLVALGQEVAVDLHEARLARVHVEDARHQARQRPRRAAR